MLRLSIGYPAPEDELELLRRSGTSRPLDQVKQVLGESQLCALKQAVGRVHICDEVLAYVIRLVCATRSHPLILQGASPRATLALAAVSRARALSCGRDYVIPEDVASLFEDAVAHRLLLSPEPGQARADSSAPVREILRSVKPPRIR